MAETGSPELASLSPASSIRQRVRYSRGDVPTVSLNRRAKVERDTQARSDGLNRWSGVHRLDAAHIYRLALEHGGQAGPFHAIAEGDVPFKAIAEVIGRRLGVPVVAKTPEEAGEHFGGLAMFAGLDMPASSEQTRSRLGWEPQQPGLLADIDQPGYFAGQCPR